MKASKISCSLHSSWACPSPIPFNGTTPYILSDSLSKVIGAHTLKFGGEFHADQVNEHPNATFNGTFNILGTETGSAFADFLLGVPSNFTQSTGQPFYLRNRYAGAFFEDSWRVRSDLTLNLGVRWDVIMPWWEKNNNIQTVVPGEQSVLYPNALPGLVVPGDPGIPSTLSPSKYHNFAPRIGLAYSPRFDRGILGKIFGGPDKSSVRASYGIFYTAFPGLSAGIMYSVPPFGYNYLSPFAAAFRHAIYQCRRRRAKSQSLSDHVPAQYCFGQESIHRIQLGGGHSYQRRSLFLPSQRRPLYRGLHAVDISGSSRRASC